jgi:RimJ/RimL family protein N-acetyltransferase
VINYLFFDLNKHRVSASVDPNNTKSIKLLEKLGMRKEAYFIKSYRMGDMWLDDFIYAMLEEEWKI